MLEGCATGNVKAAPAVGKAAIQPDHGVIEQLQIQTQKHRMILKRTRQEVADDEEALRVASRRKEMFETQLHYRQRNVDQLEEHITTEITKCSTELLKPLLYNVQAKLPLELREKVYEGLIDSSVPRVLPKSESNGVFQTGLHVNRWGSVRPDLLGVDVDPFSKDFFFDPRIMGTETSNEIKDYFLRTTPIYFRGSKHAESVSQLLSIPQPFSRHVREVVRYLRVYLRCEDLADDIFDLDLQLPPVLFQNVATKSHAEYIAYETYRSRLDTLHDLPYSNHKIKLEICVFHDFPDVPSAEAENTRRKYNLLEVVKSTYFHAKDGGAEVTVRYEHFGTGKGTDVTWELNQDAEASGKRQQPIYHFAKEDEPLPRKTWLENIATAQASQPQRDTSAGISWKHALSNGPFSSCHCAPCDKVNLRPFLVSNGFFKDYTFANPGFDSGLQNPNDYGFWPSAEISTVIQ